MIKHSLFLAGILLAIATWNVAQGQNIVAETTYAYNSNKHQYLTQTQTLNSDGTTSITVSIYPKDYAAGNAFIDTLVASRLISLPIERVSMIKDASNNLYIVGGTITRYSAINKLPEAILTLEIGEPIPLASFKFSNSNVGLLPYEGSAQTYIPDSRYKVQTNFDQYSYNGKLLQQTTLGKVYNAYLWDESKKYLLAEISNAKLEDVAYTSFEFFWWYWWEDFFYLHQTYPKGGWTFDINGIREDEDKLAGRSSFLFDNTRTVNRVGLNPAKTYSLSYWKTQGSHLNISGVNVLSSDSLTAKAIDHSSKQWIFIKHKVTGGTDISISGNGARIDELCILPQEATIKTYSYNYLTPSSRLGIGEIGDANGKLLRYEYDNDYRLINVRDVFYNTLEKTEYHIRN